MTINDIEFTLDMLSNGGALLAALYLLARQRGPRLTAPQAWRLLDAAAGAALSAWAWLAAAPAVCGG